MQLALKARSKPIRTVSFVPPMISTGRPDISLIHRTVQKSINKSEGTAAKKKKSTTSTATKPSQPTGSTGGSLGNLKQGYAANQSADLSSSC